MFYITPNPMIRAVLYVWNEHRNVCKNLNPLIAGKFKQSFGIFLLCEFLTQACQKSSPRLKAKIQSIV